ncbi:MAG: adenylosuccinate synthetase [Stellaceae bacterium]
MPDKIVLVSGPIGSGKSTLAQLLVERYGAILFKTNELIRVLRPKVLNERSALQRAGELLDRLTGGEWVSQALMRKLNEVLPNSIIVVDAVRIRSQIDSLRQAYGTRVYHIHLTASVEELARRYARRKAKIKELPSYAAVRQSKTERNIEDLAPTADVVVNTDRCVDEDVLTRAAAHLHLCPRSVTRIVDVLVGGQWGSEGKGNIVAHIAPEYRYLMRVGGPNAGHKVYGNPIQTFHHIPSGALRTDAQLLIGPGAVLRVPSLLDEIARFGLDHKRLSIDPSAMIISDADIERERERLASIGSTAQGVGEATARKINDRGQVDSNGQSAVILAKHVAELRPFVRDTGQILEGAYLRSEKVLLEGTQGTSLSLHHGAYPHVTSRDTTVSGCLAEAGISPARVRKIVMVCRTYPIRVGGTSGPIGTELTTTEIARRSGLPLSDVKSTERTSTTDRPRRIAEFNWVQLRRSAVLNGPTDIALTFVDYLSKDNRRAHRFEQLTDDTLRFIEEVESVSGVPVTLISTRFHWRNIIDRRSW